ncbi:hypothetical protein [Brevibacterium aurantiacum]|uniref:Uncharacterized protein n=1 Tax=Brevibacterium aurantiacum TaxID=273384 RepID=A0A556CQH5_BREAU|nr:hypothetical protein [Brevibacterium aurantiacum]TSI19681.1 hypothetical protein FO013_01665 [Brevibacterium aurantiacum]
MNELQREYYAFINNMDVRLGAFVLADLPETFDKEDGETVPFPKDFGPKSLPMLEFFVLSRFSSPDEVIDPENRRFVEGLIRYLGETYLRAIGGAWDHDEETGNGMPFIRPDTEEGPLKGEPIPILAIILAAVDARTAEVFTAVLSKARENLGGDGAPKRSCTGLAMGMLTAENSSEEEVEFLSRFIGTVEPGIAAWTQEQADPSSWEFGREALVRLGKQLKARYDSRDEMMTEDETEFVAGAMRFIGETIRRIGFGQWRYGAHLEADDPRSRQPFIRFRVGDQNLDMVPWRLAQTALDDSNSIASGLDTIISMREEEAASEAADA